MLRFTFSICCFTSRKRIVSPSIKSSLPNQTPIPEDQNRARQNMFKHCRLDTYAMVKV